MKPETELAESVLEAWRINNQTTVFLIENLADELWSQKIPGYQNKTIRMLGAHLHNVRRTWIRSVGKKLGVHVPERVEPQRVSREELVSALHASSRLIEDLIRIGLERNGALPKFSLGAVVFANYMTAGEAHHRGQIIMVARQLGQKLPREVTDGVWNWPTRSQEARLSR